MVAVRAVKRGCSQQPLQTRHCAWPAGAGPYATCLSQPLSTKECTQTLQIGASLFHLSESLYTCQGRQLTALPCSPLCASMAVRADQLQHISKPSDHLNVSNTPDADGCVRGRVLPEGASQTACSKLVALVTMCTFVSWPYLMFWLCVAGAPCSAASGWKVARCFLTCVDRRGLSHAPVIST